MQRTEEATEARDLVLYLIGGLSIVALDRMIPNHRKIQCVTEGELHRAILLFCIHIGYPTDCNELKWVAGRVQAVTDALGELAQRGFQAREFRLGGENYNGFPLNDAVENYAKILADLREKCHGDVRSDVLVRASSLVSQTMRDENERRRKPAKQQSGRSGW